MNSENLSNHDPYAMPKQSADDPNSPLASTPSIVPKIFGITHIIYAVIGVLLSGTRIINPAEEKAAELTHITAINAYITLALGLMLLVSGTLLIKNKKLGLKLSNYWAIIRIVLAFLMLALSYNTIIAHFLTIKDSDPRLESMTQSTMTVGLIVAALIVCAYPIVTSVLLNSKNAKSSLD